jgi:sec-independent protein translocase protein TatB
MFGIGGMELLVILLVALLVLGPERLPQITKWLAKVTREIRRASDEVRMHLDPDLMEYAEKRSTFFNRNLAQEEKREDKKFLRMALRQKKKKKCFNMMTRSFC